MAVKFSEFVTATTTNTNTRLVGFDGVAGSQANKQLSLSLTGIYSTDGILSANRTVTMNSNDLTFVGGSLNLIPIQSGTAFEIKNNPSSGTAVSMLKVKESGLFYIGKGAIATSVGDIVIGELASVIGRAPATPGIAIGKVATTDTIGQISIGLNAGVGGSGTHTNTINIGANTFCNASNSVAIGSGAIGANTSVSIGLNAGISVPGTGGISIGSSSNGRGINSIAIGSSSLNGNQSSSSIAIGASSSNGTSGVTNDSPYSISIGSSAKVLTTDVTPTGGRAVTINASGVVATNEVSKSFKVFMTDGTTPDFDVVAGGESTLNTSLKITGQAYTELNAKVTSNLTFNWNDGNIQSTTGLTGSPTFTATNPKAGATYIITLTQTGPVTATWTGVKWPGGTAPTLSGASKTDVITLICYDATGAGLYYGAATLDLS